jgi:hypothetical protein
MMYLSNLWDITRRSSLSRTIAKRTCIDDLVIGYGKSGASSLGWRSGLPSFKEQSCRTSRGLQGNPLRLEPQALGA